MVLCGCSSEACGVWRGGLYPRATHVLFHGFLSRNIRRCSVVGARGTLQLCQIEKALGISRSLFKPLFLRGSPDLKARSILYARGNNLLRVKDVGHVPHCMSAPDRGTVRLCKDRRPAYRAAQALVGICRLCDRLAIESCVEVPTRGRMRDCHLIKTPFLHARNPRKTSQPLWPAKRHPPS